MMIELLPQHLEELVISSYKSGYPGYPVPSSQQDTQQGGTAVEQ